MEHDKLVSLILDIAKQNRLTPIKFEPSGVRIFDLTLDTFHKLYRNRSVIAQINLIYPLSNTVVLLEILYWSDDDLAQIEKLANQITESTNLEVNMIKVSHETLSSF